MEKEDKKNWFYFVVALVKQLKIAFKLSIKFDAGSPLPEQVENLPAEVLFSPAWLYPPRIVYQ